MNRNAVRYVVDASVAVKLFLAEDLTDKAEELFRLLDLEHPPIFHVPEMFFIECANVFRTRVKIRAMSVDNAMTSIALLKDLPLVSWSSNELASSALELAVRYDLSVYDGCYVALAVVTGALLVTADNKLARKMTRSDIPVVWLGGFLTE